MHITVTHFSNVIEAIAPVTFETVKVRPHFPVDFPPRNSVSFSNESYELFEIPRLVDHVFRSNLSIGIYIGLSLSAV